MGDCRCHRRPPDHDQSGATMGDWFHGVVSLPMTTEDRFWQKVDKSGGCWVWTATTNGRYGRLKADGGRELLYAHRYSYELHYGEIPEGMVVMHSCDDPLCVRPEHLRLGTQSDNMVDCVRKGRHYTPWSEIKTHCKEGHPLDGENLYHRPDGTGRECLTCRRKRSRS